jgi:hypothetical protein
VKWTVWIKGSLGVWYRHSWFLHKAAADAKAQWLRTVCGEPTVKVEREK